MEIVIGKNAGFCFGVKRAAEEAYRCLETGVDCATLGPLIHNPQEVERLRQAGIGCVDSPDEVNQGQTMIIRSHGAAPEVYAEAERLGIPVIDATCPHVAAIHRLVMEYSSDGSAVIIVGEAKHPEVRAIAGWAQGDVCILNDPKEAEAAQLPGRALVVAQTTLRREHFESVLDVIRTRVPDLTVRSTICAATSQRQEEAEKLSSEADVMIVVGGHNSSNTNKLYETCRQRCERSYLIETADEVPSCDIRQTDRVALTAGASTPQWLLNEVAQRLEHLFD
ncbi:MAG: 4-hydroxy-3-methylbut-2-enyl diphosphate reductase [Clostridia bacterium]|nr:4-hydroxy-3-methylbut-2-enyl diphosphate reductase [Clostridia bacterium]